MKKITLTTSILVFLSVLFFSNVSFAINNLSDENWWKTATLEDVKKEIKNGANVNEPGNKTRDDGSLISNFTPLMFALLNNADIQTIKELTEKGADLNAKASNGYSALGYAVSKSNNEIIEYLIKKGADPKVEICAVGNLLEEAENNKDKKVIKTLSKYITKKQVNNAHLIFRFLDDDVSSVKISDLRLPYMDSCTEKQKEEILERHKKNVEQKGFPGSIQEFCQLTYKTSAEVFECTDKLKLYVRKEDKLPSCLNNMQALLTLSQISQATDKLEKEYGWGMVLAMTAAEGAEFNCSVSKMVAGIK